MHSSIFRFAQRDGRPGARAGSSKRERRGAGGTGGRQGGIRFYSRETAGWNSRIPKACQSRWRGDSESFVKGNGEVALFLWKGRACGLATRVTTLPQARFEARIAGKWTPMRKP